MDVPNSIVTSHPHLAEGLIWASLCAATVSRYCAHATQRITHRPISTRRVAMCMRYVLTEIVHAILNAPRKLTTAIKRAIQYLANNAHLPSETLNPAA